MSDIKKESDIEKLKSIINAYARYYLDNEKYGTATFLKKMKEEGNIKHVGMSFHDDHVFLEKVLKYLWDDAFKFNREVIFETTEFRSLESVIRAFMYSEGIERFKMFKQNIVDALQNPDSE